MLKHLANHSDNAPQHFKNGGALNQFATIAELFEWLAAALWDYGPPGHGKGVWDGVGADQKQYICHIILRLVTDLDCVKTTSGQILTALDVKEQLDSHYGAADYQPKRAGAVIDKYVYFYASEDTAEARAKFPAGEIIKRPATKKKFDSIEGIKSAFQFYVLKPDVVLQRDSSCHCLPCEHASTDRELMASEGIQSSTERRIQGCERGSGAGGARYRYSIRSCACHDVDRHGLEQAKRRGQRMAATLVAGDWLAFEATNTEIWIARSEENDAWDGDVKKQHSGNARTHNGVRFDNGDWMLSLVWYEQDPDGDSTTYRLCENVETNILQNANTLRLSGSFMQLVAGSDRDPPRRGRDSASVLRRAIERRKCRWRLSAAKLTEIRRECQ